MVSRADFAENNLLSGSNMTQIVHLCYGSLHDCYTLRTVPNYLCVATSFNKTSEDQNNRTVIGKITILLKSWNVPQCRLSYSPIACMAYFYASFRVYVRSKTRNSTEKFVISLGSKRALQLTICYPAFFIYLTIDSEITAYHIFLRYARSTSVVPTLTFARVSLKG